VFEQPNRSITQTDADLASNQLNLFEF